MKVTGTNMVYRSESKRRNRSCRLLQFTANRATKHIAHKIAELDRLRYVLSLIFMCD